MSKADERRGGDAGGGRGAAGAGRAVRSRQDPALKRMLAHPALRKDFMQTVLPGPAAGLVLSTLECYSAELVSSKLELRYPDTVWVVLERGTGLRICVNVEFQSRPARNMPERVWGYRHGIRRAALVAASGGSAPALGGVLSVVLYTGHAPWTASRYLEGEGSGKALGDLRPRPQYALVDLARSPCDDLGGRSVFAVVQRLHCAELGEVLPLLRELMRRAAALGGESACAAAGEFVVELLRPLGMTEKLRAVIAEAAKGGGEMPEGLMLELEDGMPAWYRKLIEKGRAKGVQEGRAQGVQEGERRGRAAGVQEGRTAMLLRFAERKFGPEAAERLAGAVAGDAGSAGLALLGDWIFDCGTLDEVLERVENGDS